MTTENLRREARVDARVPLVIWRGKTLVNVETSDVSFKGLFVRTLDPPPLRSLVRLKVAIAGHEFEAHAMAVHVVAAGPADAEEGRIPGVGLQFWGLSGRDRSTWDDFVRGLVQAQRLAAKVRASTIPVPSITETAEHPALTEPNTPSGVRIVVSPTRTSSK